MPEPPDGGWGWMVTIGYVAAWITTLWPSTSFTLVFEDFLESTGQSGSLVTLLNSLGTLTYYSSTIVTDPLLKRFSMRSLGLFSAMLFCIPNIMIAFTSTAMEMIVMFALQGTGIGIVMTILSINFNAYFVKKRSMVMSISQAIIGLGGIIYPIGIEKLMKWYGSKGAAAILGALNLHCIFAMALMRPPPGWNSKEPDKTDPTNESKEPLVSIPSHSLPKIPDKWSSCGCLKDGNSTDLKRWSSIACLRDYRENKDVELLASAASSKEKKGKHTLFKCSPTGEYKTLLTNRKFVNMCVGSNLVLMSDGAFCTFLPLMMTSRGFSRSDAALAITTLASTELASRVGLAAFTTISPATSPRFIFFVATIAMTLARLGFLFSEGSLIGTMSMVAVIGAIRAWLMVPQPLVVVEDLRVDQFGAAYALYAIMGATVSVTLTPFAGIMKDWTGSYFACQIVWLVMTASFIVPWGVEIILKL